MLIHIVHYIMRIFLAFPCRLVKADSKLLWEFTFIRHGNPDNNIESLCTVKVEPCLSVSLFIFECLLFPLLCR
jgi:hypothetical protein